MRAAQARLHRPTLAVGGVALAASLVGALTDRDAFMQAWLVATLFWLALPLGAMAALMAWNLTGGGWGEATAPASRAAAATLPVGLLALLVLLVFGLHPLFAWTQPAATLPDLINKKTYYLNLPFFVVRTLGYAAIWLLLAWRLGAWQQPQPALHAGLGAGGAVLWVFSVTFFAFDWVMSLEPLWYSDVFGLVFGASIVLPAMALVLLASELASLGQEEPMVSRLQDYANLLLAVVLGWVFFDFSQYLIIWMGNLPHEIDWFVHRSSGGWRVIAIAILVLLFIAPTVLLLSRRVKRSRPMLMLLSAVILVGHYLNCWWLVIPTFHPDRLALDWSAAAAWLGIGGVALSVFLGHLATFREAGTEHAGTATSRNAEASP